MADSWIKMRECLQHHPKVLGMVDILDSDRLFRAWMFPDGVAGQGFEFLREFMNLHAVKGVVIGGLHRLWSWANHHVSNGFVAGLRVASLDEIVGIEGFGAALAAVGWVVEDPDGPNGRLGILFPDFRDWNTEFARPKTPAERAREYRARKAASRNRHETVTKPSRDSSRDVTKSGVHDNPAKPCSPVTSKQERHGASRDVTTDTDVDEDVDEEKTSYQGLHPLSDDAKLEIKSSAGGASKAKPRRTDKQLPILVPPELQDLELYRVDEKLCARWPTLFRVWVQTYPGLDVLGEVLKAHAWEVSNPERRKVNRARSLNTWLARAQDRPRQGRSYPVPPPTIVEPEAPKVMTDVERRQLWERAQINLGYAGKIPTKDDMRAEFERLRKERGYVDA